MPRNTKNKKLFKFEVTTDWISIHALKPKKWSLLVILTLVLMIVLTLIAIFFKEFRNQAIEIVIALLQFMLNYTFPISNK